MAVPESTVDVVSEPESLVVGATALIGALVGPLFARLPRPLTHAAAVSLGGRMLVLGGRRAELNTPTRQILAISPSGAVSVAGELPRALSDLAAVALGQEALLAGGRDAGGRVRAEILRVSVR